jgi:electron transfer flavoprotein beta subunit
VKILVTVKRVPDPEQKVKFKGAAIDVSAANWVLNAFDEYAIEAALRLNENAATGEKLGETIALSIGPKEVSQQLRSTLAMGADRAILVGATDEELDSFAVARIIKAVVDKEKPDLVLMGKLATDGEASQVPQIVAALLDWPQATFAAQISVTAGGLEVKREVDTGMEVKSVKLPAVVSVDLRIISPTAIVNGKTPAAHAYQEGPRYASLKGIMAAKKKEIKEISVADLGVKVAPVSKVTAAEPPAGRKAGVKVKDVAELMSKLKNEAKVL